MTATKSSLKEVNKMFLKYKSMLLGMGIKLLLPLQTDERPQQFNTHLFHSRRLRMQL